MNKNIALFIPVGVACVMVVAASVVQGYWTNRFGATSDSEIVHQFSDRLGPIPKVIGEWEAVDHTMNPQEQEVAGIVGYISRNYTNSRTKESVTVMLVCGNFRNIAKHEPTQCYVAAGFTQEKEVDPYSKKVADDTTATFNTTVFKREEQDKLEKLRIFWSWNFDGEWVAPSRPRWNLAGKPALYKLYVISNIGQGEDIEESASLRFINEFIPVANKQLFPKAGDAPAKGEAKAASSGSEAPATTEEKPATEATAAPADDATPADENAPPLD
jgi:hypothetical protein